jgi:hypothetical protein
MIKVCIEVDDKGQVTVGQEPPEQAAPQNGAPEAQMGALMGGEGQERSYMKPVASVDEALAVAKQMLAQGQGSPDTEMAQGFGQPQPTSQMRSV